MLVLRDITITTDGDGQQMEEEEATVDMLENQVHDYFIRIVRQNLEKPLKCVHSMFFAGFLIF